MKRKFSGWSYSSSHAARIFLKKFVKMPLPGSRYYTPRTEFRGRYYPNQSPAINNLDSKPSLAHFIWLVPGEIRCQSKRGQSIYLARYAARVRGVIPSTWRDTPPKWEGSVQLYTWRDTLPGWEGSVHLPGQIRCQGEGGQSSFIPGEIRCQSERGQSSFILDIDCSSTFYGLEYQHSLHFVVINVDSKKIILDHFYIILKMVHHWKLKWILNHPVTTLYCLPWESRKKTSWWSDQQRHTPPPPYRA